MPGRLRRTGLVCAIVLTFGGCGGGDDPTIPSDDATQMLNLLDTIEAEAQEGNCEAAEEQATTFAATVDQLPEDVDPKVRQGLSEASVQLVELTRDDTECTDTSTTGEQGAEPAEEEPAPVEEEEPVTTTSDEPDTTTEEEPEEDQQDEEQPPAPGEPANEGNGPPLDTPSENTPGGGEPRAPESGGLEPERAP